MNKLLYLVILFLTINFTTAHAAADLDSAVTILSQKISYRNPYILNQDLFAELAYLKRTFNIADLKMDNDRYIGEMNDYYYKKFFTYSRFLNDTTIVTADCLEEEEIKSLHQSRKLIFYCIYPNTIKLPANIIDQLEEYATVDEFFGPYNILYTAYFLKKYNFKNLSKIQKEKLKKLEEHLSGLLYKKYIENKPWGFHKFLSCKVLKMNNSELVKNLNIDELANYINANLPLALSVEDKNNIPLLNLVGSNTMFDMESISLLWLLVLENNK